MIARRSLGPADTGPSAAERALAEVHAIHAGLGSLLGFLITPREHTTAEVREIKLGLAELRRHLPCHFALEEKGGFLEDVVRLIPMREASLVALWREHAAFVKEVDRLHRQLSQNGDRTPRAFRIELYRFIEDFRRHESAECELFREAYLVDTGGGD